MTTKRHKLRDGEVALYKRPERSRCQVRFKLPDRLWHNVSTFEVPLQDMENTMQEMGK